MHACVSEQRGIMIHDIAITSMEVIAPKTPESKGVRFKDLNDFFDIDNHHICDVVHSESKSRDSKIIGKHTAMLLSATGAVFKDSFLDHYEPHDIGIFTALGMFDYDVSDLLPAVNKSIKDGHLDYTLFFKKGFREIYPLWPLTMLNNIAMCQCAIRLGIKGDNGVFSPHSDSSLNAIYEGWMSVVEGRSRVAIAGAVSEIISPLCLVRYLLCNTKASRVGDTSNIPSYALSEGVVAFCLENICNAQERGISALCVINGFGASFGFDEINGGATTDAITTSMRLALEDANLKPNDINLIFTHDDTQTHDGHNEDRAIKTVFGNSSVTTICTKPFVGDMLSCAGAFDVSLGIRILLGQTTNIVATSKPIKHILINAMSVEGNVTSLIIGRGK
ncbi:MAG: hypothetical protein N3A62_04775 [Thermodesulfovibrionales bacterium]|nr:hypothetical protein [Thermodesulfovibrionales bacterium]